MCLSRAGQRFADGPRAAAAIIGAGASAVTAGSVQAHELIPGLPPVLSVALHPFVMADTLLLVLAFGLALGACRGPRTVASCVVSVAAGAALGLNLQAVALAMPGLWRLPLVVGLGLALLAAIGVRIPPLVAHAAALVGAITLGLGVQAERGGALGAFEAWAGTSLALLTVLVVVSAPLAACSRRVVRLASQVAGSWIVAIAALALSASMR